VRLAFHQYIDYGQLFCRRNEDHMDESVQLSQNGTVSDRSVFNRYIDVTCLCSEGCKNVQVMFYLNENKYKGYCGRPYSNKYLRGSKCARFCKTLSYGKTCSIGPADSNKSYRVKGKSGRGGKWDTKWKSQGYFSTDQSLSCGGR